MSEVVIIFNYTKNEFDFLRQSGYSIDLNLKFHGDETTPISIFYSLRREKMFLLESSVFDEEKGRYSFIGIEPYAEIRSRGLEIEILEKGITTGINGRILDQVQRFIEKVNYKNESAIPFQGGAVGYVGYDVIKQYECILNSNRDPLDLPEAYLMFYKKFVVYDHYDKTVSIHQIVLNNEKIDYEEVQNNLLLTKERICSYNKTNEIEAEVSSKKISSNTSKEEFVNMVSDAKKYIENGDAFQIVVSQRFSREFSEDPFKIYRKLRSKNPSPYMFFIDYENFQIVGSSPESLVTVKGDVVTTMPIAGTRKRGANIQEDEKIKEELLKDEKELAEHLMLVDLARNDIGRISKIGTVKVERFMDIEIYSKIMHIVSKVTGILKEDNKSFDALKFCLPAGTLSGAPKIRAMEIIEELEKEKRTVYAGAIGYFSFNGDMDTCIAIRTVVLKDGKGYVQAGAGIVYDSIPEMEYEESYNKALGVLEVIK
ncbi:anthranilate synthase component I [Clostridium folliculivorans]|nr:anthranilate synthase component I [Clostridium folliculivorans]